MKYLMIAAAMLSTGCANFGNVTRMRDEQAKTNVTCMEFMTKFSSLVGYARLELDQHEIEPFELPKGNDERTQPYRRSKGCHIGKITRLYNPISAAMILCREECNQYTKAHGFALVKLDGKHAWAVDGPPEDEDPEVMREKRLRYIRDHSTGGGLVNVNTSSKVSRCSIEEGSANPCEQ